MKHSKGKIVRGLMVAVLLSIAATVCAADYPKRDITFIVPFGPGGGSDPICRQFASQLEKALGGNINIENKPGGSATIGIGAVVRAKPDGYTIGHATNSALAYMPLVNRDLPYKTSDDYQSVVKQADMPYILAVRADAPWKTFEDFMADVKKKPGKMRVSVSGMRTGPDLTMQLLNQVARVKIATVPFTGGAGEALIALLGGRVDAYASTGVGVVGHAQAGTVRVLAVFQKGKYDLFPGATPVVDAGYNVSLPTMYSVIAPKGMPKDVLDKLVGTSLQVIRSEEYRKFAKAPGYVVDVKGPEAMKAELVQYGKTYADLIKFIEQK